MSRYLSENTKMGDFNLERTLSGSFFVIPQRLVSIRVAVLTFTVNKQTNTLKYIYIDFCNMKPYDGHKMKTTAHKTHHVIFYALHNLLQFFHWDQIPTCSRGTSPLDHYHLQLHDEGMSNHSHPLEASCLRREATGTWQTQWIHHRQHGGGLWLNPVYMVSVVVKCCATVGFVGTVYIEFHIKSSLWCMQ